jgi:hypothetical protein
LEQRPVQDNYLWHNFAFSSQDLTNFDTGADYSDDPNYIRMLTDPRYQYTASVAETNPPLSLTSTSTPWIYFRWINYVYISGETNDLADVGVSVTSQTNGVLASSVRNLYGLSLTNLQLWTNHTISPGSNVPLYYSPVLPNFAQPALQIVDYYFASQTPYFWYNEDYGTPRPPLPGSPDFTVTNASPVLIASFGYPFSVAGWAKMAITNGYSGKYAYLEQYFDKAYKIGTNGAATTNQTGILSPYGEFFPTEPGPIALVTMPDIDTGQRGTGVVNVVKLQLDMNHDGVMDLSLGGPDNTSAYRPFVFWINNDSDFTPLFGSGWGEDIVDWPPDFRNATIPSTRDLEDFARVWICGLPALPTNQGYQVTLTWGSISSGSPAIRLANTGETNGGIGYLTDTNVANTMLTRAPGNTLYVKYPTLMTSPVPWMLSTNVLVFPATLFTNAGDKHFLFEGAGIGSGQLLLSIVQGSNVIAQTSAWLDLHDVKDFYERMVVSNHFTGAISNWSTGIGKVEPASSAVGDDTNIIVLVHGINVSESDWLIASDTVLKRLYWSGYQGRFATVKWPCEFFRLWTLFSADTAVFNRSEIKAYKSGMALKSYMDQLHTRYVGYPLHLLAHSQGNAVVSEAIEQGGGFDTYILTEGALPASSYDVNYPLHAGLSNTEAIYGPTPEWRLMGYRGIYTNMSGRIVNFYNTNDPVLAVWISDQGSAKPNVSSDYHYNGTTVTYQPTFGSSYTVTDPQESRAFASRSRTLPVGQSPSESAHGVIQSGIDLKGRYGFNNTFPDDHSAQWAWPIQMTRPYFQQVLTKCQIQPAP